MDENLLPRYVGTVHPDCDEVHGQIPPARGVKCYQVTRANARHPEWDDNTGYTYKHAPDLCLFHGRYYIQYLCNPESEHLGAGQSILASSADGVHWDRFTVSFPPYRIPACTITDCDGTQTQFSGDTFAVMHQRMSFYQTKTGRMLVSGFYGFTPEAWICPWDRRGTGRVVRELYEDGTLSDIYFIYPNWQAGWSRDQLLYPLFDECPDEGFKNACRELLSDRLATQQWAEENGDKDNIITIKHGKNQSYQAFCWYHTAPETVIGLFKHSFCARSDDNGNTWSPVQKSWSLVMSGQKVWGCQTPDGAYAMVYDPTLETQHRYPLCITTSKDGLSFDNMRLVCGDLTQKRYPGLFKDFGFQYMRGICEGMDRPDDRLLIAYSVNKEDIWIAHIPTPVCGEETAPALHECLAQEDTLANWNLYCPKWASAEPHTDGLLMRDADPADYCRAEHLLAPSARCSITVELTPKQDTHGCLYLTLCTAQGADAVRIVLRDDGTIYLRTTTEIPVGTYRADETLSLTVHADCRTFCCTLEINSVPLCEPDGTVRTFRFMRAVNSVSRFVLRTGAYLHAPTLDMDPEKYPKEVLPGIDEPALESSYLIHRFDFEKEEPPQMT